MLSISEETKHQVLPPPSLTPQLCSIKPDESQSDLNQVELSHYESRGVSNFKSAPAAEAIDLKHVRSDSSKDFESSDGMHASCPINKWTQSRYGVENSHFNPELSDNDLDRSDHLCFGSSVIGKDKTVIDPESRFVQLSRLQLRRNDLLFAPHLGSSTVIESKTKSSLCKSIQDEARNLADDTFAKESSNQYSCEAVIARDVKLKNEIDETYGEHESRWRSAANNSLPWMPSSKIEIGMEPTTEPHDEPYADVTLRQPRQSSKHSYEEAVSAIKSLNRRRTIEPLARGTVKLLHPSSRSTVCGDLDKLRHASVPVKINSNFSKIHMEQGLSYLEGCSRDSSSTRDMTTDRFNRKVPLEEVSKCHLSQDLRSYQSNRIHRVVTGSSSTHCADLSSECGSFSAVHNSDVENLRHEVRILRESLLTLGLAVAFPVNSEHISVEQPECDSESPTPALQPRLHSQDEFSPCKANRPASFSSNYSALEVKEAESSSRTAKISYKSLYDPPPQAVLIPRSDFRQGFVPLYNPRSADTAKSQLSFVKPLIEQRCIQGMSNLGSEKKFQGGVDEKSTLFEADNLKEQYNTQKKNDDSFGKVLYKPTFHGSSTGGLKQTMSLLMGKVADLQAALAESRKQGISSKDEVVSLGSINNESQILEQTIKYLQKKLSEKENFENALYEEVLELRNHNTELTCELSMFRLADKASQLSPSQQSLMKLQESIIRLSNDLNGLTQRLKAKTIECEAFKGEAEALRAFFIGLSKKMASDSLVTNKLTKERIEKELNDREATLRMPLGNQRSHIMLSTKSKSLEKTSIDEISDDKASRKDEDGRVTFRKELLLKEVQIVKSGKNTKNVKEKYSSCESNASTTVLTQLIPPYCKASVERSSSDIQLNKALYTPRGVVTAGLNSDRKDPYKSLPTLKPITAKGQASSTSRQNVKRLTSNGVKSQQQGKGSLKRQSRTSSETHIQEITLEKAIIASSSSSMGLKCDRLQRLDTQTDKHLKSKISNMQVQPPQCIDRATAARHQGELKNKKKTKTCRSLVNKIIEPSSLSIKGGFRPSEVPVQTRRRLRKKVPQLAQHSASSKAQKSKTIEVPRLQTDNELAFSVLPVNSEMKYVPTDDDSIDGIVCKFSNSRSNKILFTRVKRGFYLFGRLPVVLDHSKGHRPEIEVHYNGIIMSLKEFVALYEEEEFAILEADENLNPLIDENRFKKCSAHSIKSEAPIESNAQGNFETFAPQDQERQNIYAPVVSKLASNITKLTHHDGPSSEKKNYTICNGCAFSELVQREFWRRDGSEFRIQHDTAYLFNKHADSNQSRGGNSLNRGQSAATCRSTTEDRRTEKEKRFVLHGIYQDSTQQGIKRCRSEKDVMLQSAISGKNGEPEMLSISHHQFILGPNKNLDIQPALGDGQLERGRNSPFLKRRDTTKINALTERSENNSGILSSSCKDNTIKIKRVARNKKVPRIVQTETKPLPNMLPKSWAKRSSNTNVGKTLKASRQLNVEGRLSNGKAANSVEVQPQEFIENFRQQENDGISRSPTEQLNARDENSVGSSTKVFSKRKNVSNPIITSGCTNSSNNVEYSITNSKGGYTNGTQSARIPNYPLSSSILHTVGQIPTVLLDPNDSRKTVDEVQYNSLLHSSISLTQQAHYDENSTTSALPISNYGKVSNTVSRSLFPLPQVTSTAAISHYVSSSSAVPCKATYTTVHPAIQRRDRRETSLSTLRKPDNKKFWQPEGVQTHQQFLSANSIYAVKELFPLQKNNLNQFIATRKYESHNSFPSVKVNFERIGKIGATSLPQTTTRTESLITQIVRQPLRILGNEQIARHDVYPSALQQTCTPTQGAFQSHPQSLGGFFWNV